nr:hypothetical protein [Variovorax boronicumulans]
MTDIEANTRRLAAEMGAEQGRHPVDGRDLVGLAAGWLANRCAHAADAGGLLAEMTFALADSMEGWGSISQQRFTGALAKLCAEIAAQHPARPGDAVRDAFLWTGWCHDGIHGSGTLLHVRINGQGVPEREQRRTLEAAFGRVLLRELVTPEAVNEAYKAARSVGQETYWARQWATSKGRAMAEVFPNGLPPKTQLRTVFSYSPW